MLCIFDDMITSPNLNIISNLFLVDGRHNNLSMVFITQKLFVNNDEISQNSDYFIIFKNPHHMQEIHHLNSQMNLGKNELTLYYKLATTNPFSYIMINLTQECDDKVKYLSNLFNSPNEIQVYNDNKVKKLSDGKTHRRTQFNHMCAQDRNLYIEQPKNMITQKNFSECDDKVKYSSHIDENKPEKLTDRHTYMCAQDFEQPKNMFTQTNNKETQTEKNLVDVSTQTEPKAIKQKMKNKKECKSFIQPPVEYKSYDQMLY